MVGVYLLILCGMGAPIGAWGDSVGVGFAVGVLGQQYTVCKQVQVRVAALGTGMVLLFREGVGPVFRTVNVARGIVHHAQYA